jgi:L-threonate 2-dehydrogenase
MASVASQTPAPIVAIVAPGGMGAAVGGRLVEHGCEVRTSLAGRSAASRDRAAEFGLRAASDAELVAVDWLLSIVPPAEALPLAEKLAPQLAAAPRKPIYVDCNAVSPETAARIAAVIAPTGCAFVDVGIIGLPPKPGSDGPVFYASGDAAPRLSALRECGLNVSVLDGPVGAASALKMSYAGLTKGFTALGAAMILAASRAGAADALHRELSRSQPNLLAWLGRSVPAMFPKAYRFVGEMHELRDFLGDVPERAIFEGNAGLYTRLAEDHAGPQQEVRTLAAFLANRGGAAAK